METAIEAGPRQVPGLFEGYVQRHGGWQDSAGLLADQCDWCGEVDSHYLEVMRDPHHDEGGDGLCENCARNQHGRDIGREEAMAYVVQGFVKFLRDGLPVRTTSEFWGGALQQAAEGMISR